MRIYGLHSGRNNMSRLIARSIMYNSRGKNNKSYSQVKPYSQVRTTPTTNVTNNESNTTGSILFIIFLYVIIAILILH